MCATKIPGKALLPHTVWTWSCQFDHLDTLLFKSNYVCCQVNLLYQCCQVNSNKVERDSAQQLRELYYLIGMLLGLPQEVPATMVLSESLRGEALQSPFLAQSLC